METKNENQIFNPFDLIQRTEPKKKRDYIVKIIQEPTAETTAITDASAPTEASETTTETVLIKDKRKNSLNLVERSLILKRIQSVVPIERNLLSKSPQDIAATTVLPSIELDRIEETIENEKNYEIVENKIEDAIQEPPTETTADDDAVAELDILPDAEPTAPAVPAAPAPRKTAKKRPTAPKEKEPTTEIATAPKHKQKLTMGVSSYYMNNRKLFIQQLSKLFRPYHDKIAEKGQEITCKTAEKSSIDFGLLTHQLVVRDYLNLYTPYRGLLLYHGLGSGKTCTSIGIAEGMKSDKNVILMTPASLKMNFFSELKKCGDVLFRKNNFWEFISIEGEPDNKKMLSDTLGIPKEYVQEKKGSMDG
jgi:hypothetical protein